VRIIADTNILIRAFVQDDPGQAQLAAELLRDADAIAISSVTLCEFVWTFFRELLDQEKVMMDRRAVNAGLDCMEAGGSFADGVIAFEGSRLGGEVFATFDRRAAELLPALGIEAKLLGSG
jgi:predicted nucleic-acid-binding protein